MRASGMAGEGHITIWLKCNSSAEKVLSKMEYLHSLMPLPLPLPKSRSTSHHIDDLKTMNCPF